MNTSAAEALASAASRRHRLKVALAFLILYTIWGSTYLAIRVGVRGLPPALFAGIRFVIAGSLILAFARWRGYTMPARLAHVWLLAIVGFLLLVTGNGLVVWAEQYVDSGLTSLILGGTPFLMVGIEALLPDGERIGRRVLGGLLVGFAGFLILVWPDVRAAVAGGGAAAGVLADGAAAPGAGGLAGSLPAKGALLIASISWTCGSLFSKRRGVPVRPLVATGIEMLCGGAILLAIGLASGDLACARWDRDTIAALVYLIVFGAAVGFTAYIWLLDHVPASRVATISYVNPIVALLLGWALLGEHLSPRILVAAAVVILGVVLVTTAKAKKTPAA
jgi:drug/metabolite transporter (DMT)-like permease